MEAEGENQKNVLLSNVFSIWVVLLASAVPCTSKYWYRDLGRFCYLVLCTDMYTHTHDNSKCLKLFHFSVNNPAFDCRLYLLLVMIAITRKALMFFLQRTVTVCVRLT